MINKRLTQKNLLRCILLFFCLSLSSFSFTADQAFDESLTDTYSTRFWNSFNNDIASGNLEKYLSHWDENAERITPTVHARGIDEIRATYLRYLDVYTDFRQTELRRVIDRNVSISELITEAKHKVSGEIISLPNVAIVEFNDLGKVIRARVYLDTRKFSP
ncbi:MAG: hypothetical protein GKR93_09785 [Gammaproteobacteria bacterium]|nr:hypothetical protein [Gammaproteobacteria bacterium]